MLIGYARVSTEDQNLDLQLQALTDAGCDQIFSDKKSGGQKARKGLQDALSHLRPGDTLVVWKLDRLGRTVKQLVDLITELQERQINFKSLTNGIDTTDSAGSILLSHHGQPCSDGRRTHIRKNEGGTCGSEKTWSHRRATGSDD